MDDETSEVEQEAAVAASPSSSSSSSAELATTSSASSAAVLLHDGKFRGFDPSVLRGPDGKILGGGDAPEPEGAEEFFEWLRERGCTGLEDVQLLLGGGVALRQKCKCGPVAAEQELLSVPREAWLTASEAENASSVEALAWRLLHEIWAEDQSAFAPFVQQLRRKDVSAHPIMWEDEEVAWLASSPEGLESVNNLRALTRERVARLLARAAAEAADALDQRFGGDEKALAEEFRWALCLIESQGFEVEDAQGECSVALCPLLGDVRTIARKKPAVLFEASEDRLSLAALRKIKPGEELMQRVEQASGAWLLANLGVVPGSELPGVPNDKDLLEMNTGSTCMLQPAEIDASDFPRETYMRIKLRLLDEYAGLDLTGPRLPTTLVEKTAFVLPDEATGVGRLLPTVRFLISEIQGMGGDVNVWMDRWFVRFFRHCKLERGYPSIHAATATKEEEAGEVLKLAYGADLEVTARRMAMQWVQEAIIQKSEAIDQIAGSTGLPVGNAEGVIVVREGQTVMAYFKAKRKDGSTSRSKKPREAKVVSVAETTLRVEFVANRRRHEIPTAWVVSTQPVPDAKLLTSGCTPQRLARGKLAITLLRTERAILGTYLEVLDKSAETLEEQQKMLDQFKFQGDEKGMERASYNISHFLARELVEVDEDLESLQPQSLDDLAKMPGDGETTLDKPLWNVPDGNLDPTFSPDILVADTEESADGSSGSPDVEGPPLVNAEISK